MNSQKRNSQSDGSPNKELPCFNPEMKGMIIYIFLPFNDNVIASQNDLFIYDMHILIIHFGVLFI